MHHSYQSRPLSISFIFQLFRSINQGGPVTGFSVVFEKLLSTVRQYRKGEIRSVGIKVAGKPVCDTCQILMSSSTGMRLAYTDLGIDEYEIKSAESSSSSDDLAHGRGGEMLREKEREREEREQKDHRRKRRSSTSAVSLSPSAAGQLVPYNNSNTRGDTEFPPYYHQYQQQQSHPQRSHDHDRHHRRGSSSSSFGQVRFSPPEQGPNTLYGSAAGGSPPSRYYESASPAPMQAIGGSSSGNGNGATIRGITYPIPPPAEDAVAPAIPMHSRRRRDSTSATMGTKMAPLTSFSSSSPPHRRPSTAYPAAVRTPTPPGQATGMMMGGGSGVVVPAMGGGYSPEQHAQIHAQIHAHAQMMHVQAQAEAVAMHAQAQAQALAFQQQQQQQQQHQHHRRRASTSATNVAPYGYQQYTSALPYGVVGAGGGATAGGVGVGAAIPFYSNGGGYLFNPSPDPSPPSSSILSSQTSQTSQSSHSRSISLSASPEFDPSAAVFNSVPPSRSIPTPVPTVTAANALTVGGVVMMPQRMRRPTQSHSQSQSRVHFDQPTPISSH